MHKVFHQAHQGQQKHGTTSAKPLRGAVSQEVRHSPAGRRRVDGVSRSKPGMWRCPALQQAIHAYERHGQGLCM
jgi:hypothetical protein